MTNWINFFGLLCRQAQGKTYFVRSDEQNSFLLPQLVAFTHQQNAFPDQKVILIYYISQLYFFKGYFLKVH